MFRLFSPNHLRLHETFIPPPNAEVEYRSHETLARSEHISTPSTSPLTVVSKYPPFATSEDPARLRLEVLGKEMVVTKGRRGSGEGFGMVNIDCVFIVGSISFSRVVA